MPVTRKKKPMGGYREGSGRKALYGTRMVQFSISLPEDIIQALDEIRNDGESRADLCRKWIMGRVKRKGKKSQPA